MRDDLLQEGLPDQSNKFFIKQKNKVLNIKIKKEVLLQKQKKENHYAS